MSVEIHNSPEPVDISEIESIVDKMPIDKQSISQERLNLVNRERTSVFPWRGQFSPELVETLLDKYDAKTSSLVLDPFVGSGSTLFEAGRKGISCFGSEINPAAFEMARTACFINLDSKSRESHILEAELIVRKLSSQIEDRVLFSEKKSNSDIVESVLSESLTNPLVYNIVVNTLIRYAILRKNVKINRLWRAFSVHKDIIRKLPYSKNSINVFHNDARLLPLENETIDLIVTSPPYINVFNYHQNYRQTMELVKWDLLKIAKSEIGSNRKHRANRYLTVIQYAIDMLEALCEMKRVTRKDGRIIIVVGRESKIRNVSFQNYKIIAMLAIGGAGLNLVSRQERKFVTRFGDSICEDLLHFIPSDNSANLGASFARKIGVKFLEIAKTSAQASVKEDIISAINTSEKVEASPRFIEQNSKIEEENKQNAPN